MHFYPDRKEESEGNADCRNMFIKSDLYFLIRLLFFRNIFPCIVGSSQAAISQFVGEKQCTEKEIERERKKYF